MEKFDIFCRNVCSFMPRATSSEKAEISAELTAHMEDHYDAMVARGVPEDEAMERAVREMGDYKEIGRELNATLSPFWLWVSRIATFCLVVIIVGAALPLIAVFMNVYDNIDARFKDATDLNRPNDKEISYTASDIEFEVSGHIIKVLSYGTAISNNEEQYGVHFDSITYAKNVFAPCNLNLLHYLEIKTDPEWDKHGGGGGYSSSGGSAMSDHFVPVPYGTESVTLVFDRYGYYFEAELPLDWGEGQ